MHRGAGDSVPGRGRRRSRLCDALVEWQIAQGTPVLSPVGTTGESPTLTHDEHERVIAIVVEAAAGRAKVMAGTGSNSTAEAIRLDPIRRAGGCRRCSPGGAVLQST